MKKKWLAMILTAAMALSLAACNGGTKQESVASTESIKEASSVVEEEETEAASATVEESATSSEAEPLESEDVEETTSEAEEEFVGMPNPWTETTDLDEAVKATGIDYMPPVEGAVPEGMNFFKYLYTTDTIDTLYESVNDELRIRVSINGASGDELAGDYNEYSQTWEQSLKGLVVHCRGDGEKANVVTFDVDNIHWAVLFNAGYEGNGLTMDQVNSLVNGMQAVPLE